MFKPHSTYRIQFHKDFNFADFERVIPYLQELGIDTVYASPIFEAVPGSMHGYDIINMQRINPEIGTERQLLAISRKLRKAGISWVQDIVPNHMAFHPSNSWLMDVLEHGQKSSYTSFFDIRFPNAVEDQRLMVPFLGEPLEEAIKNGFLKLKSKADKFYFCYYDSCWPVNAAATKMIKENHINEINKTPELLLGLANAQYYRLCSWQETDHQINFRRFFTVNGLICLNIQNSEVFHACHEYVFSLMKKGVFQGLRIDHVDGLYDPGAYLYQLRKAVGDEPYIVVEKILEKEEKLPLNWPIQGTTGYDFLALVNNLFTNVESEKPMTRMYRSLTGKNPEISREVIRKKQLILDTHMQGELDNLCQLFLDLKLCSPDIVSGEDKSLIRKAIATFLIHFPVYRFYQYSFPLKGEDLETILLMLEELSKDKTQLPVLRLLEDVFIKRPLKENNYREAVSTFFQRCMQFSGPLMAKGVEDTLMYTYNRFAGHNEVGDAQDVFGITTAEFHQKMELRQQYWPLSMNATATHDTKRGEDIRARLNVLSDIPERWKQVVQILENAATVRKPDANDTYLIYQTLLGAMPMPGEEDHDLMERLKQYLEKALREAKLHSDWADPAKDYEDRAKNFAAELLENTSGAMDALTNFLKETVDFGIVNSLVQLLLKFTCPGIPDVYQGNELWDLSLVDPDNRRAVDYRLRSKMITDETIADLWKQRSNGKIKLWMTRKLMQLRKTRDQLFTEGTYLPLKVKGRYKRHILAFARRYQHNWIIVTVPLGLASLCKQKNQQLLKFDWKNTRVVLPEEACEHCVDLFNGTTVNHAESGGQIEVNALFSILPMSLMSLTMPVKKRGAGILMPLTALPSAYGIGDAGPEASAFVDFLACTHQKYWQLLPLNPTEKAVFYSPYSATSAMAAFDLMISPDWLRNYGLLEDHDLKQHQLSRKSKVNYEKALSGKARLLEIAYHNFNEMSSGIMQLKFDAFLKKEAYWLDDFALYTVLKAEHTGQPWVQWPDKFKYRDKAALKQFASSHTGSLLRLKWNQFIFFEQWLALKSYANVRGVQLIGDLPLYIGHDAVDVWANPSIFDLDADMNVSGIAGVPPDYFNEEGQLWGMPVFKWSVLEQKGYQWWIERIRKNLELFDLVRLDHFRAFSAYWVVPAGSENAVNGTWKQGPGARFFNVILQTFAELPFIAEDLGEIDEDVYLLRDQFGLPGMKVLQFAFGADMSESLHLPPNYSSGNCIVYTGTHDNNTALGWYGIDASDLEKNNLQRYIGRNPAATSIHQVLVRIAFSTIAEKAIIPISDLLGLYERARINNPGTSKGNWSWRMKKGALTKDLRNMLRMLTRIYGRD